MSGSAIVTLILASVILYGGLFVTLRKAMKSSKKEKD